MSFSLQGPPPSFNIDTGGAAYFAIQVTSDPALFNGALAARRTQNNFFDSWYGDDQAGAGSLSTRREIPGEHLEAPTGRAVYTIHPAAWKRLKGAQQLYYRLTVFFDERRRQPEATFDDVNWLRAPSFSIAPLPAQPARPPAAAFRGRSVLSKPDFAELAAAQVKSQGMIQGRDGDIRFAVLDAKRYHLTVVECHERGLTDTIQIMPRKPDAVINGQFLAGAVGIDTEGQVIREGVLIHRNSQSRRDYLAQTWRGLDIGDDHIGEGNPSVKEPQARAAFGGLGPVLHAGAPVTPLTPWARSIYDFPAKTGRGVIALERQRGLILLLVQQDNMFFSTNAMKMSDLRAWLQSQGFDDAVFNDGSDSEALYAGGGWMLEPGFVKDEVMDFAIGFVDRQRNRRARLLAIDGTRTPDAQAFITGLDRPPVTHYSPRDISQDLKSLPALASIGATFRDSVIQAWRAASQAQADQIGDIIELAGSGGYWADAVYISSHAWRHGQLWYYQNDPIDERQRLRAAKRMIADLWSSGFQPVWRTTPRWLIIAGCAVLAVRYARGVGLDAIERGHLVDWHHDIHGAQASVPGLTTAKQTLLAVYHPGWAWHERAFKGSPGLRGVLGYWYRSPSGGRDVEIVASFVEKLRAGESFLSAWEAANRGGWFDAEALWAAQVRPGCEDDTLATLEDTGLPPLTREFRYFDRYQRGRTLSEAYRYANRLDDTAQVGGVTVRHNSSYDQLAINELNSLAAKPTAANFLEYSDGVGP